MDQNRYPRRQLPLATLMRLRQGPGTPTPSLQPLGVRSLPANSGRPSIPRCDSTWPDLGLKGLSRTQLDRKSRNPPRLSEVYQPTGVLAPIDEPPGLQFWRTTLGDAPNFCVAFRWQYKGKTVVYPISLGLPAKIRQKQRFQAQELFRGQFHTNRQSWIYCSQRL